MLKSIHQSDIQVTPFVTTKPWVLTRFHNQDVLVTEPYSSSIYVIPVPIAEEFIDYAGGDTFPLLSRECNIALEQQVDDTVLYEEGQKIEGTFYPESDPINNTGTYKRLVYNQIKNAFYNEYNDPTKIFGSENIDFQLSEIKKFLTDNFRVFNISKQQFGERMMENTIVLTDNTLDDNFEIIDDGNGNIFASPNLFGKVQEVRHFGNFINNTITSSYCDSYYSGIS